MSKKYLCYDGGIELEIEANSASEAAREYVDGGDWDRSSTIWINVDVTPVDVNGEAIEDERERMTITLDPDEPDCEDGEHDWRSPYSVLGGVKENPGVWGHGAGLIIDQVCAHCGRYKTTDTWAQNPETGEQGLKSVAYRDADDDSLAWLSRRAKREVEEAM